MTVRIDDVAAEIADRLGAKVTRDAPSAALTTYRCGGPLAVLVRCESEDDLAVVAGAVRGSGVPLLVVGKGSNLLVADAGFPGVAVVLAGAFDRCEIEPEHASVDAGGAVALPVLARRSAAAGVGGLEFYVGIPGSVGGAVRMNAGGHGRETAEVLVVGRVWSIDAGTVAERTAADLRLGYRTSALGDTDVVVSARFSGSRDDPDACGQRIDEIVKWRRTHQPGGQNAGSVFTNPPGDAAGRLIESCGLKGFRVGGVVVSEKHANFFVAEPGARAADVRALIAAVARRVEEQTGVRLHPELRMVGFGGDS